MFIIFVCLALAIFAGNALCAAFNKKPFETYTVAPVYSEYAGSAACVTCHNSICSSQLATAHALTSHPAASQYIKGSFHEGSNLFIFNKFMNVVLDSSNGAFWQRAFAGGVEYEEHTFDIAIGSGRKGQTYLYWDNASLYQLPISYYTPLNCWCNSPGFPANFVKFDRQIPARCLECHGTFANAVTDANNNTLYDSTQMIYGVTCERCHGPAGKHVAYQSAHPTDTSAMFIVKIKALSRQQKLDACALCHSGAREALQPTFTFETGDKLDDYSLPNYNTDSASMLDVHGNQFGLLTASKCFQLSKMDCSSCHNTHVSEVNKPEVFAGKCISCHADVKHAALQIPATSRTVFNNNCITCHMPVLASNKIALQLSGQQEVIPDYVRSHRIAVYPKPTKDFLKELK